MEALPNHRFDTSSRIRERLRAGLGKALHASAYWILSDEALLRRSRARDRAAFEALVARHRGRLYTLALGSLGSADEAGDALCEMVVSAFNDLDSADRGCTPGAWLYLHGFRVVFKRMNIPAGRYTLETQPSAGVPSA